MQEQGVRPDNPEYLKAHNFLSAVQRQQVFHRQRYAQQQQQLQAQQRQQQLNGTPPDAIANGHGKEASTNRVICRITSTILGPDN